VRTPGYALCAPCQSHRDLSGGVLADLVVPVSYSPRTGQHHHNLRSYKASPPSLRAKWNVLALLLLFLRDHLDCINTRAGGRRTHLVTVPSTRGIPGPHPLALLIGDRLGLPRLGARVNATHEAGNRQFRPEWFEVEPLPTERPVHALVLDDTWTTGAHAQSLAHRLKASGAASVAVVALGRHVRPEHEPSRQLLNAIKEPIFDLSTCAAEGR